MAVFNSRRKDIGMKGEKRWGRERESMCVCEEEKRRWFQGDWRNV